MLKNLFDSIAITFTLISACIFSTPIFSQTSCSHQHHQLGFCAVAPSPDPLQFVQPDGSTFMGKLTGTPAVSYIETEDGYVFAKDSDGFYKYLVKEGGGKLNFSNIIVHAPKVRPNSEIVFLETIATNIRYSGKSPTKEIKNLPKCCS